MDDLHAFVRQQDAQTLASILIELSGEHEAVLERLLRLQLASEPKNLAGAFRKTLAAWKQSRRDIGYAQAGAFGRELEAWLGQIERELMPTDPAEALALAEAFIEADHVFFEMADDSDGAIGEAIRAGCQLWLKAASHCKSPPEQWPERILRLVAADEYGARDELLRRADLLLGEQALRGMVAAAEIQIEEAAAASPSSRDAWNSPEARASSALHLLGEALRDPDVLARALLVRSPVPNPHQKSELVRACIEYGRPADALPWLEGSWEHLESSRLNLKADVLSAIGRTGDAAALRQRLFEASLSVGDFHAWLDLLDPGERPAATERARTLASAHSDPVVVARLLLDIGDDAAAEAALLRAPGMVDGGSYFTLLPMAERLEATGRWAGATVLYRALLVAILDRAYTPAYRHGARYWSKLQSIAGKGSDSMALEPPDAFEARIRAQHKRKSSFWAQVSKTN